MKYRVCVLAPVCLALQVVTAQSLITEDPADPDGPGVFNAGVGLGLAGDVTITRDMNGKTDVKFGLGPGAGWKASFDPTVQDLPKANGTLQSEIDISIGAGPVSGGGTLTFTGDTDGYFGYDASVSGSAKLGLIEGKAKAGFVAGDLFNPKNAFIDPYANASNGMAVGGGLGVFGLIRINWFGNAGDSTSENNNMPTATKVMPIGVNSPQ